MKQFNMLCRLALASMLSLAALSAAADADDLAARYPPGSISSVEMADAALKDVERERDELEARYTDTEYGCYSKFFSSPCVSKAKEERRSALERIKPVEVEASAFKRRDVVAKRDRILEEQRLREQAAAPERAEKEKANEAKAARKAADVAARQAAPEKPPNGRTPAKPKAAPDAPPAGSGRDRIAEHEAKMEKARADHAAQAGERAENVAAFERKQQQALERQRKVEEKKAKRAERERERAARAGTP